MKNNQLRQHCRHSAKGICKLCQMQMEVFAQLEQRNALYLKQEQKEGLWMSAEPQAIAEIKLTEILLFSNYPCFRLGSARTLITDEEGYIDLIKTNAIFLDEANPYHATIHLKRDKQGQTYSVMLQCDGEWGILVGGALRLPPWTGLLEDGQSIQIGLNRFRLKMTKERERALIPNHEWVASLQVLEMANFPVLLRLAGRGDQIAQQGKQQGKFRDEFTLGCPKSKKDKAPDWALPSPLVSRYHASFFFQEGKFYLRRGWFGQPCKKKSTNIIDPEAQEDRAQTPGPDPEEGGQGLPLRSVMAIQTGPYLFTFRRVDPIKEQVSRLAKSYQFQPTQQERLTELLEKNKEGVIQPDEEKELDALLEELDRRKLRLADEIQKLAHQQ